MAAGAQNGSQPEVEAGETAWPTHPEVDLTQPDPALLADGTRRCTAQTRTGERCTARPLLQRITCAPHAGLLDSAAGGRRRAAQLAERREALENRMINARLGPRAVVLQALQEKHDELRQAVHTLVEAAAAGDLAAAKALPLWLNQALGAPSQPIEMDSGPVGLKDVQSLSQSQIAALLKVRRPRSQAS